MSTIDPRRDTCLLPKCWRPATCPDEPENTITVSPSGGDFTTLEAALAAVVSPGPANRYEIVMGPGVYPENNPLPLQSYAVINGSSEGTTRITALNANQDMFTSAQFTTVQGVAIAGVSGTGWVIDITDAHNIDFRGIVFLDCVRGVRINNANAVFAISDLRVFSPTIAATISGITVNAGTVEIDRIRVEILTTVTTLIDADGANASVQITNSTSRQSGVTTFLSAKNSARVIMNTTLMDGMVDGIVMESGANVRAVASTILNAQQDGLRINNVGANCVFAGDGLTIEDATRYSYNILSATAVVSGFGKTDLAKINSVAGAQIYAAIVDLTEDDEGVNVLGELHVGTAEFGAESVMGGGDSYTRGMLVYTYNPTGPVWTDESVAARSASGSTFTFPAVAQNNAIYVASSLSNGGGDYLQHYGIKLSCTVAAILGGGSIVVEYWNGASWVAIEQMSTLASAPYTQYANDLFLRAQSEQLRYPLAFLSSWAKNDPMSLGTNYYWIRYRIASAITTAPTFEQWKLHTARFEVNSDGATEYFGAARYPKDLLVHQAINSPVTGSSPSNAAVAFTAGTTLTLNRNQFNDNQVHSFGSILTIPTGIDTSIPLTIEIGWYPDTNNAGDVELETYFAQLEFGDLWDGSVADTGVADISTVPANDRYVSRATIMTIDVSELIPGELLVFRVQRDATVGNPDDTLAGNIIIGSVRMFGYFWRP